MCLAGLSASSELSPRARMGDSERPDEPGRRRRLVTVRLSIHWLNRDHFPVATYQRGRFGRVLVMSGLSENLRLLHLVRSTDQLICFTVGDYLANTYETMRHVMALFSIRVDQVSVFCNYPAQVEMARTAGLQAFYCNHNAFISADVFQPLIMQKRFDAVCVAHPTKWKRVPLASQIGNLAIVRGPRVMGMDYEELEHIPHAYMNEQKLSPRGVMQVLSASRVGLALSAAEGACLASSEYLLCGLPVVSTPSRGGRDIWYDQDNSVICEPTREAVSQGVRLAIERLACGELQPGTIRQRHIAQALPHRKRFIEVTARIFDHVGAAADSESVMRHTMSSVGVLPPYRCYEQVGQELCDESRG